MSDRAASAACWRPECVLKEVSFLSIFIIKIGGLYKSPHLRPILPEPVVKHSPARHLSQTTARGDFQEHKAQGFFGPA